MNPLFIRSCILIMHVADVFVQSFRFGAQIAYVGATILKVCKGVDKILVGGNQKGKYCINVYSFQCLMLESNEILSPNTNWPQKKTPSVLDELGKY